MLQRGKRGDIIRCNIQYTWLYIKYVYPSKTMLACGTPTHGIISILARVSRMTIIISARAQGRINAIIRLDLPSALTSPRFMISCLLPVTCAGSPNLPSRTRARLRVRVFLFAARVYISCHYAGGYVTAGLTTMCARHICGCMCAFVCTVRNE